MKGVARTKKSDLVFGMACVGLSLICLGTALFPDTRPESLLWWLSGAGIAPGAAMIVKYFYRSSPKNRARYAERMENEQLEMQDELKVMIRDRAGRYTNSLSLPVISFSMVIFSVLGALAIIEN